MSEEEKKEAKQKQPDNYTVDKSGETVKGVQPRETVPSEKPSEGKGGSNVKQQDNYSVSSGTQASTVKTPDIQKQSEKKK